jgi:hypothetical protein
MSISKVQTFDIEDFDIEETFDSTSYSGYCRVPDACSHRSTVLFMTLQCSGAGRLVSCKLSRFVTFICWVV